MMLQILLNNFIRDFAGAPRPVADCPEVSSPIALPQVRILLLQNARRTTFEPLNQIRQSQSRRRFDVHMNMILADHSTQNPHVLGIANLHQQLAASGFYVALQNVITICALPIPNALLSVSLYAPLFCFLSSSAYLK